MYWLILFVLPSLGLGADLFHPMGVLDHAQMELRLSQRLDRQEREYEDAVKVLDEREYRAWLSQIEFGIGLWNGFTARANVEVAYDGDYRKTFDSSIPLNNQHSDYSGIRAIGLHLQYYSTSKQLAFEIYGENGLIDGRERNASIGGTNAGMAFKYLHELNHLSIYGRLFLDVAGKKRIWRLDNEREIVDPYTKFGNELSLRRAWKKFWMTLSGHFMLTTDFVTRSPSYVRSSDKGFGLGGKFEIGYNFDSWAVRVWHSRSSEVFNVIPDEPTLEAEFEIEDQSSVVEFAWSW